MRAAWEQLEYDTKEGLEGLGFGAQPFPSSVSPSSSACAWKDTLACPSTQCLAGVHPSRDGKGPWWLQESCSCGVTHLGAPTAAPDRTPAIPAPGDIEFSVCFASVIGQDAVKGGENVQGRGVKEIGRHY